MAHIELERVCKTFRVTRKQKGLAGAVKGLFRPDRREVHAVRDVSFAIEPGELVGFIGPNGAGKSTTIKMLSGILYPTSGRVSVVGLSPQRQRRAVVQRIGAVFGQRSQLNWDLRLGESYELFKRIYRIADDDFERSLAELCEVLGIGDLLDTPVRQMSLGQRMRGELAGAMLHEPDILFLDEPTMGMDIEVKAAIRAFIRDINQRRRTTVLLTTHDLDDVEELCERLIIINQGRIIEDGPLAALIDSITPHRYLIVECEPGAGRAANWLRPRPRRNHRTARQRRPHPLCEEPSICVGADLGTVGPLPGARRVRPGARYRGRDSHSLRTRRGRLDVVSRF